MASCTQCNVHERMAGGSNPYMYRQCQRHDRRTEAQKIDDLHQAALDDIEAERRDREEYMASLPEVR